ncbi:MAG: ydfH1 [Frankiales bacterium]|nr:ydfH1 [Frankiales bacterium]
MTSATDLAYATVKQGVLQGDYPGGELLSEGEVAAVVGVSRTPVREAFLRLQAEGLLKLYPKRGALVVPVSVREVDDVLEARRVVETFAVEKAVTSGAAVALGDTLAGMLTAQSGPVDLEAFAVADRAFHFQLVAAAGNDILTGLYESLRDRQLRMSLVHVANSPERLRSAMAEHQAIADALRAGDEDAAHTAVQEHLARTGEALRTSRRKSS